MNTSDNLEAVLPALVARVDACAALVRVAQTAVAQKLAASPQSSKLDRALEDLRLAYVSVRQVADELRFVAAPPTSNVLQRVLAASDISSLNEASCNARRPRRRLKNGTRAERGPEVIPAKQGRPRK